jgi:hypothetical protein
VRSSRRSSRSSLYVFRLLLDSQWPELTQTFYSSGSPYIGNQEHLSPPKPSQRSRRSRSRSSCQRLPGSSLHRCLQPLFATLHYVLHSHFSLFELSLRLVHCLHPPIPSSQHRNHQQRLDRATIYPSVHHQRRRRNHESYDAEWLCREGRGRGGQR